MVGVKTVSRVTEVLEMMLRMRPFPHFVLTAIVGALFAVVVPTAPSTLIGQRVRQVRRPALRSRPVLERLTEVEREGFRRALSAQDERYDPKERMVRRPFSSPGYHTTLKGGFVHPTRDSLTYAVALLDSGEQGRLLRGQEILKRVVALQDKNPSSRTYGIWSWFLEEPLSEMSPPDWNWADFCGVQLLQVGIDHMRRLPPGLANEVKESILHAARSIKRRNVGPGYTNIALMGTYVTLVAGELFHEPDLIQYGTRRLRRFYDHTLRNGSFSEYNSPTYTIVAIKEISRMLLHVRDRSSRRLLNELNRLAWNHVARRFHPATRQWAGPHSRSYSTFLGDGVLAFIQRGTGDNVPFMGKEKAAVSLDAHRLRCRCPDDLIHYFTFLRQPRFEKERFVRSEKPFPNIIGSTWLHPAFTLGSVNCGDFWNQRRPLLAYWGNAERVSAFRVRFLHDGYDYSSAMFFSVQDKGDLLAAVNFATDGGDTHVSLDRLKNATISASDLRLRFLIEGAPETLALPSRFQIGEACRLDLGGVFLDLCIPSAAFGDFPITTEMGRDRRSAWLDIVFYHGKEREISFTSLKEAVVSFALRMQAGSAEKPRELIKPSSLIADRQDGNLSVVWKRDGIAPLALEVETVPQKQRALRSAARARIGTENSWE